MVVYKIHIYYVRFFRIELILIWFRLDADKMLLVILIILGFILLDYMDLEKYGCVV